MARLQRSWRTLRALSWAQLRLLVQAWLLLPLATAGLRLFGFGRMQAMLHRTPASAGRNNLAAAQAIARIVHGAARWSPVHAGCLVRSLVLCRLLHRRGLASGLRIGVARPDGRFAAHAWVEHGGTALAEAETIGEHYVTFGEDLLTGGT
jgi:hypothetical protein